MRISKACSTTAEHAELAEDSLAKICFLGDLRGLGGERR
jgi:hypothetical protein